MEHIHWLHITHSFVPEIRQDLFLDDAALCDPIILTDTILQVISIDLVERIESHIQTPGILLQELTFPSQRITF
jgi:hypothetical protein